MIYTYEMAGSGDWSSIGALLVPDVGASATAEGRPLLIYSPPPPLLFPLFPSRRRCQMREIPVVSELDWFCCMVDDLLRHQVPDLWLARYWSTVDSLPRIRRCRQAGSQIF